MYPTPFPPSIERIRTDRLGRNGIIMVPLLHPLQSRLFADRTHNWILYPIEKRVLGVIDVERWATQHICVAVGGWFKKQSN